jgi:hypothetical protein
MIAQAPTTTPKIVRPLPLPIRCVREVVAVVFWLAVFVKAFVFDFDGYVVEQFAPEYQPLLNYRFFAILALFVVVTAICGKRWFVSGFLYLALYPLVVGGLHVPRLAIRRWPLIIAFLPAIHAFVTRFRANLIFFGLAVLSIFAVCVFDNPFVLVGAMLTEATYLARHFYLDIKRAFSPSGVFTDLAEIVRKLRTSAQSPFKDTAAELAKLDPSSPEYKSKYQGNLILAYAALSFLDVLAQRFRDVARSRLLDAYLIYTIIVTVITTVVVFAVEFFALYKLDTTNFDPQGTYGLLDFIGFSFTTLMTGSISKIQASSGVAQVIAYCEYASFLFIAVVGAFLFFTTSRERQREDMDQVAREIESSVSSARQKVNEELSLTDEQLEDTLLVGSLDFVNTMRKLRRLDPRTAPAVPPPHSTAAISQPASIVADSTH